MLKNPLQYFFPDGSRVLGPTPCRGRSSPARWPAPAGSISPTSARLAKVGDVAIALAGTDDPHLRRARYSLIAGAADPQAVVRIGVIHSPEPSLLRSFAADGYDLVLAGHTHGGQIRMPFGPAIVTNCGIDVRRARWLHQWDERMWFHVCAGLGTNPFAPVRIACRPEASLLTLGRPNLISEPPNAPRLCWLGCPVRGAPGCGAAW